MSIISLKATLAAGTGTGKSFSAYDLKGPTAVFREDSPIGIAGTISLKRTEPKSTKDYAGAARGEVRFTRQFSDALGRQWPAVFTGNSSIPAFLTDAQKQAFIIEGTLAFQDVAVQDTLSKLLIPQS